MTRTRRIVVTGAGGFVGRPATEWLLRQGWQVHAVGRRDPGIAGLHFHVLDLLRDDPAPLLRKVAASHLLHLGWSVRPGQFWTDPANAAWADASARLFGCFAEAGGRRIVGAGTCAEYDWTGGDALLDEAATPIRPATPYGAAKAATWEALQAISERAGLSVGWGRLFFLYGAGEARGRLVSDTIAALLGGERIATSGGEQIRDFMDVADAGRALGQLAAGDVAGAVNVASGEGVRVRALIEAIERAVAAAGGATGLVDYGARPMRSGEPDRIVAATRRLHGEAGFTPGHGLAEGIARTVDWWRQAGSR